jgi:twitching motility protein PilT
VQSRPSVSASQLLAALQASNILDEQSTVTLLGEARHAISLNELEMLLVHQGVISSSRLLALKGATAGLPVYDDPSIAIDTSLDDRVVRRLGVFRLHRAVPTVAMVEDLEESLEKLTELFGVEPEVWLITAPQFDDLFAVHYKGSDADRLQHVTDIYEILDEAIRRRASDIHLSVGLPPVFRVDGSLLMLPRQPLTEDFLHAQAAVLTTKDRLETWNARSDVDFAFTYGSARFRVNLGRDRRGMTVAARKIPSEVPSMDDIKLPAAVRSLVHLERGLVLVVGPTGSGKSTTLAAMLAGIAGAQQRHIITLEDPIEFLIPPGRSVVHQRELHQSFDSFPQGLRQALRQDPDVVLVGEMRDIETIRTAITAAETGHLVFGTLHTFDAPSTVGRLVSSFPADEQDQVRAQLSYILKAVVAQTLIPLASMKGRVAAFEIMLSNPAIQNNLRKVDGHAFLRQTIETSTKEGMQTMEMALVELTRRGAVRVEDAELRAPDLDSFRRRVDRGES